MNTMEKRRKLFSILGWGIFIIAGLTLCLFLQKYMTGLLDSDEASEMVLSALLAKNGGILSPDWYYSTELRVLNNQIIFSILLRVLGSWHQVRMIASVILYGILIAATWGFCRSYGLRRWFPYAAAVMLLPISGVYFNIVLKGVYYIPHIVTLLLTLALLMLFAKEEKRTKILSAVFSVFLALSAGMGGLRLLLVCYLPLMAATLCYGMLTGWKKRTKPYLTFAGISFAAAICGYLLNRSVLSQHYTFRSYESVVFTTPSAQRLFDVLSGFLQDLGYTSGSLFSASMISCGIALIILVLSVYCAIQMIRHREKRSDTSVFLAMFYLVDIGIFLMLYCFTNMTYYAQYSLPVMVLSVPVCFCGISEFTSKKESWVSAGILLMTLAIAFSGIGVYRTSKENVSYEKADLAWFLLDSGYQNGYATAWNANVLTELTNGQLEVWDWGDQVYPDETMDLDHTFQWLQLKSHDTTHPAGKVFILLAKDQDHASALRNTDAANYVIRETNNYVVYGFPSYEEMCYATASFQMNLANGKNLEGGTDLGSQRVLFPGGVSEGPERQMPEGEYQVKISGFDLETATVSCSADFGAAEVPISNVSYQEHEITFDIMLSEQMAGVEFRIENPSDENFILTTLEVRRVE